VTTSNPTRFDAIVIGARFSGLYALHRLRGLEIRAHVEVYLNFVADRLDLRRDISFNTKVVAMTFDEDAAEWILQTEAGESFVAPFVVAASGILSVPLEPAIAGMDAFAGTSLYTSRWPNGGVEFAESGSESSAPDRLASS
jgi:cation diffusion facilitator CzcD-associated flavoprotein CzcO